MKEPIKIEITFPLKLHMRGAAATDLHQVFRLLLDRGVILVNDQGARRELSIALERERAEQTYGDATHKLVGLFQDERRLQASGEVDEPTADALNRLLHAWGLLEKDGSPRSHVVSAGVRREDGLLMPGGRAASPPERWREQGLARSSAPRSARSCRCLTLASAQSSAA